MAIGLRVGVGVDVGPGITVGAPGSGSIAGVTRDVTSGVYLPQSTAEWTLLMAAAGLATGNPSNLWLLQEASGDPADSIGAKTLTATGTRAYQQAVTGWTTKSVKTTDGASGILINTSAVQSILTNSALVLAYARVNNTPAAERTIFSLGYTFDGDAAIEVTPTPRLQFNSVINDAIGTLNPTGQVRPYVSQVDRTALSAFGCSDAEKLVPTFSALMAGTGIAFGGDNAGTWLPATTDYLYAAVFVDAAARLTRSQIKTLLTTLGWTIGWVP